jgi:hypothetical protein
MSAHDLFPPGAGLQASPRADFFMICRAPRHDRSTTNPQQRYRTRAEAETAARTLARQTGESFVILQSVAVVTPAPDPFAKGLF